MAWRERCPKCKSTNITGRGWDWPDGDEYQERGCYDCHHSETRMRSEGGVSWYVQMPPKEPHRGLTATGLEHTLLDEIYAAPDDDGPRTVYADWLIEQGDPLGTFISLQLARHRRRDPVVSSEEQTLLDNNWSAWVGHPSAVIDAKQIEFERGFWSACDAVKIDETDLKSTPEILVERSWQTVRRIELMRLELRERQLLTCELRRSLRTLLVKSRSAFDQIATLDPLPGVDELGIIFDVTREPPPIAFANLPALRALRVECFAEYGPRWVERAEAAGLRHVHLLCGGHADWLKAIIRRANKSRLTSVTIETPTLALVADRDADGAIAIRRIDLAESPRAEGKYGDDDPIIRARTRLDELADVIDPDVKLTARVLVPEMAERADAMGMRLVRYATSFGARPRAIGQRA